MTRGRPRKTDPDDALHSAMKLFWEKGYDGTSLNELVSVTGMAKPGIYATFGDKSTLYSQALTHYFKDLGAPLLEDLVSSPDPLKATVRRFLYAVMAASQEKTNPGGCFVVNSLVDCAERPPDVEALARSFDQQRRDAFRTRFQAAQEKGELPAAADAKALADFFSSQSLALAVMARSKVDRDTIQGVVEVALSVLPTPQEQ